MIGTDLVLLVLLAGVAWLHIRGDRDPGRTAARAIFAVYLVGVAHYALLPIRFDPTLVKEAGAWIPQVGLHPFFLPGGDVMSRDQFVYNFLLGVPFGIGLPFVVSGMTLGRALIAAAVFGLAIESFQLVFNLMGLALPPWTIDVNDVILNAAGAAFGTITFAMGRIGYRWAFRSPAGAPLVWLHFHRVLIGQAGTEEHRQ